MPNHSYDNFYFIALTYWFIVLVVCILFSALALYGFTCFVYKLIRRKQRQRLWKKRKGYIGYAAAYQKFKAGIKLTEYETMIAYCYFCLAEVDCSKTQCPIHKYLLEKEKTKKEHVE